MSGCSSCQRKQQPSCSKIVAKETDLPSQQLRDGGKGRLSRIVKKHTDWDLSDHRLWAVTQNTLHWMRTSIACVLSSGEHAGNKSLQLEAFEAEWMFVQFFL